MLFNRLLSSSLLLVPAVLAAPPPGARVARRTEQWRSGLNNPLGRDSSSASKEYLSANWAGPVCVENDNTFTSVTGTFKIPKPKGKQGDSASIWVGIDGDTCGTAILQTGITLTVGKNGPEYGAWYEWYPNYAITMTNITMSAGDTIRVTVNSTTLTSGIATVENLTNGQCNSTFVTSSTPLCRQNAEWIVEDYSLGFAMVPFANFGAVEFEDAQATKLDGNCSYPYDASIYNISQNNKTLTKVITDAHKRSTVKVEYVL